MNRRGLARVLVLAVAVTAAALGPARPVLAAPGDPDPTFSGDGMAFVNVAGGPDYGLAMAQQPDGRLLLAGRTGFGNHGNFAVVRLKANGQLDPTFGGGDGRVTTDFSGGDDWAHAVAVQPNGRILVAGGRGSQLAVARYLPGGGLDPAFSDDGKRVVADGSVRGANAVTVRSSGKIVLVGNGPGKMPVVQLEPDGDLDTSFGNSGIRLVGPAGAATVASGYGVAVDASGRLVVGGFVGNPCDTDLVVVRLRPHGALDPTFSGDGMFVLDLARSDAALDVNLDEQGAIVVAGYSGTCPFADGERMLVARLLPKGTPDQAFSGDGLVRVDVGTNGDEASGVAVQPNGRIVAAGVTGVSSSNASEARVAVVRLLPGGGLDPSFGGDGKVVLDLGGGDDRARDVDLLQGGDVVLGGGVSEPARFFAARLQG
jgi:uncharacterized delta-60 repeat protein